jgi:hypothetical protein
MAIVWANLGGAATPELTLFFAAVQLPILPALLKPAYRRLGAGEPHGRRAGGSGASGGAGLG